jgi:hypothetical protein
MARDRSLAGRAERSADEPISVAALFHDGDRAFTRLAQVLLDPDAAADVPRREDLGHDQRRRQLGRVDPVVVVVLLSESDD